MHRPIPIDAALLTTVTTAQVVVILAVGLFFGAAFYEIVLHSTPWGVQRMERRQRDPGPQEPVDDSVQANQAWYLDPEVQALMDAHTEANYARMYFYFTSNSDGAVHLISTAAFNEGRVVTLCSIDVGINGQLGELSESGDEATCPECVSLRSRD